MCRACLAAASAARTGVQRDWRAALWPLLAAAGCLFAWFLFYTLGALLARIPDAVHGVPPG